MNEVSLFPPSLIRASAGTGKTFQLTNRYLRLLLSGELPERILATTFTRKAAREIAERVIQRLANAASNQSGVEKLQAELENSITFSQARVLETLERVLQNQHRLQICTLDSFCIQLTRNFSSELGLDPGWALLETHHDRELQAEAIRLVCKAKDSVELSQLIQLLSKGDLNRSVHRRLSSDITVLYELSRETDSAAWSWLRPPAGLSDHELAELAELIQAVPLPERADGSPDGRFAAAVETDLQALESRDWVGLTKRGLFRGILFGRREYYRKPIPDQLVLHYETLKRHLAYVMLSELRNRNLASLEILSLFHKEYTTLKHRRAAQTFSDIKHTLARSAVLGDLDEIYFRLDSRLTHILLDEFQDTSRYEWSVLDPIVSETLAYSTDEKTFFCVGDVKQAIYGWRGGVAEIFDSLECRWPELDRKSMNTSYRSSPVVIEMVNRIFGSLDQSEVLTEYRTGLKSWTDLFESHRSACPDQPGYVRFTEVLVEDEAGELSEDLLQIHF